MIEILFTDILTDICEEPSSITHKFQPPTNPSESSTDQTSLRNKYVDLSYVEETSEWGRTAFHFVVGLS